MFRRARTVAILAAFALTAIAGRSQAQTTYHLHNEASSPVTQKQLTTANPDVASVAIQTANLKGTASGEKLIKAFDTQSGVPNVSGTIPVGSTVTLNVWIRKTVSTPSSITLFPRFRSS